MERRGQERAVVYAAVPEYGQQPEKEPEFQTLDAE